MKKKKNTEKNVDVDKSPCVCIGAPSLVRKVEDAMKLVEKFPVTREMFPKQTPVTWQKSL